MNKAILAVMLLCCACAAGAAEVSIAGFAFSGEFKSAPERFPFTYKLFNAQRASGDSLHSFSYLVTDKAQSIKNAAFEYSRGGTVNLKSSRALMAVLALTGETVATEHYGPYFKTFVNLRGDALIFDYKSQTIVHSCPVNVVLFDATTEQPGEARIAGFIDDLIRRNDERGLITQFARCLERAADKDPEKQTVQVRNSEVSAEALALFPAALRNNASAAQAMLSDSLGSVLAAKLGVSMLPSSIGHAVGGVMTMRLENGDDIKLKLGEADYVFDIRLNKFAKIKTAETNVSATYVYGSYMTLRLLEPQLNTVFLETDLKNGESAVLVAGQVNNDDFAAYQDVIRGLFFKFADAVQRPGSKWLATAASSKTIEQQMTATREILEKCK